MSKQESHFTKDHDEIQKWAESRGGKPAHVPSTGNKSGDMGLLRIDFPEAKTGSTDKLEEISWDDFFAKFDEMDLVFLYQDKTADGGTSRFNKFVSNESAAAAAEA